LSSILKNFVACIGVLPWTTVNTSFFAILPLLSSKVDSTQIGCGRDHVALRTQLLCTLRITHVPATASCISLNQGLTSHQI